MPVFKRPTITLPLLHKTLWTLYTLTSILALTHLALTCTLATDFTKTLHYQAIPAKLTFNIVAAAATLTLAMIAITLHTLHNTLNLHPDKLWIWLYPHFLLLALWIAASVTSFYTCADLCTGLTSSFSQFYLNFAGRCCSCQPAAGKDEQMTRPAVGSLMASQPQLEGRFAYGFDSGVFGAARAVGIVLVFLSLIETRVFVALIKKMDRERKGKGQRAAEGSEAVELEVVAVCLDDIKAKGVKQSVVQVT